MFKYCQKTEIIHTLDIIIKLCQFYNEKKYFLKEINLNILDNILILCILVFS